MVTSVLSLIDMVDSVLGPFGNGYIWFDFVGWLLLKINFLQFKFLKHQTATECAKVSKSTLCNYHYVNRWLICLKSQDCGLRNNSVNLYRPLTSIMWVIGTKFPGLRKLGICYLCTPVFKPMFLKIVSNNSMDTLCVCVLNSDFDTKAHLHSLYKAGGKLMRICTTWYTEISNTWLSK